MWTRDPSVAVHIYDKSSAPVPDSTPLPNVGREAHTFAHACIELYESLDLGDTVTFLQAGFRDHVDPEALCRDIDSMSLDTVVPHASHIARSDMNGNPHHQGLHLAGAKARLESIFNIRLPTTFVFAAGAQYTVPSTRIHQYSKRQWTRLRDILAREYTFGSHTHDGIDPWQMERFWPSVFK